MHSHQSALSRRVWMRRTSARGLALLAPPASVNWLLAAEADPSQLLAYLARLRCSDGGYGWGEQDRSHLTPTYAVVGCYDLLGEQPPDRERLIEFIRTHHPTALKRLEQEHRDFDRQQIQALLWLGADVSDFAAKVQSWRAPVAYLPQYERHRYPVFRHQVTAFTCRELLGINPRDSGDEFVAYLDSRRRDDGSFNNTPADDGSSGHVLNTLWGLQALRSLGREQERSGPCIDWLRSCQRPEGGFTWSPEPAFAGASNIAYTWAALKALQLLHAGPANRGAAIQFLLALRNDDGGCGDRPGWRSNPVATHQFLECLQILGETAPIRSTPGTPRRPSQPSLAGLQVFSAQIEAHGQGSPADAVELARSLRIHLWGAKNAAPAWIVRAQRLADEADVPVTFFVTNEEYGTWVDVPGLGTYSHTSDLVAPAGADIGPSLSQAGVVSWEEFRSRRINPLWKGDGRLIWQFGENEELVRMYLDDSLDRGAYAAISTFHFGNPDFTNSEPFLKQYAGQIPYVSLQDAHGEEPWWFSEMTAGFRTLFLAREPTWRGWLEALRENRIVSVRHDEVSRFETWMHGGSPEVVAVVREREAEWRWWNSETTSRPLVSLVAILPNDEWETPRPDRGVLLRIRCARENTTQGLPKQPLAELVGLSVDGQRVESSLPIHERTGRRGVVDYWQSHEIPGIASGRHNATAIVRELATGRTVSRTIDFIVPG